ncbi:retrovirus-related pol polyprotein from transposon TNT 1-94 [Tanacetum coccineum]
MDENKIKKDLEEIETINIKLDHRVTKLIAENEHLKQTYKQLYDSIKPARIRSKEQCADLINQVNLKSVEISDLNASLQEKVLVITALKDELRKLKGKALVDNDVTKHPSDPEMPLTNMEPITPKLLNKRTAHSAYIKHTQEEAAVLRDLVDHIKANYPLDQALESACKYTKLIQELLTKISKTCPSINNSGEQLVAVTPKNKDKKVRFTEPVTSSRNTITTSNLASNKPMLSSTGVKQSTSTSGSQSSGNTKKGKIRQTPSSTRDEERKVFTNIGYTWRPTGQTFTIVGNVCPLTKITTTIEVPLRKLTALKNETPKPVVTFTQGNLGNLKLMFLIANLWSSKLSSDNGTEFVNQTLSEYYEKVGISHETFVARSPQQNGVVERRNRTLIEDARTMLIYAKAPLFLWAEAVSIVCYTQNRSIIRLRHGKTPYELLHDKPPDLSFFHVFSALCYPTNDNENLGKLQPKADIDFDELTAMASEQSSSGLVLHEMTPSKISSGLVPKSPPPFNTAL